MFPFLLRQLSPSPVANSSCVQSVAVGQFTDHLHIPIHGATSVPGENITNCFGCLLSKVRPRTLGKIVKASLAPHQSGLESAPDPSGADLMGRRRVRPWQTGGLSKFNIILGCKPAALMACVERSTRFKQQKLTSCSA